MAGLMAVVRLGMDGIHTITIGPWKAVAAQGGDAIIGIVQTVATQGGDTIMGIVQPVAETFVMVVAIITEVMEQIVIVMPVAE